MRRFVAGCGAVIALTRGMLVALFEAIAWRGNDLRHAHEIAELALDFDSRVASSLHHAERPFIQWVRPCRFSHLNRILNLTLASRADSAALES